MLPKLVFAIALTVWITFLPLTVSEDATNSMASMQREIDELKSALAKMEKKEHVSPLKFAGRVDDEAKAAKEIVAQQLEAVNVFGNAMKFQSNGPHLRVRNAQEGLDIEHDGAPEEVLTVRANLPIPLPSKRNGQTTYIAFYYEVELITAEPFTIGPIIGFSDAAVELRRNSIAMQGKRRVCIKYNGDVQGFHEFAFAPPFGYFNAGDVLGIGLLRSPGNLTLFGTANGKYLGSVNVQSFLSLDLFPAIAMTRQGERVLFNFGKKIWQFDPLRLLEKEE